MSWVCAPRKGSFWAFSGPPRPARHRPPFFEVGWGVRPPSSSLPIYPCWGRKRRLGESSQSETAKGYPISNTTKQSIVIRECFKPDPTLLLVVVQPAATFFSGQKLPTRLWTGGGVKWKYRFCGLAKPGYPKQILAESSNFFLKEGQKCLFLRVFRFSFSNLCLKKVQPSRISNSGLIVYAYQPGQAWQPEGLPWTWGTFFFLALLFPVCWLDPPPLSMSHARALEKGGVPLHCPPSLKRQCPAGTPFCFGKRPHTQLYECVDRRFREVAVEGAPIYFPPLDFEKGLPSRT